MKIKKYKRILSLLIFVLIFDIQCYAAEEIQKLHEIQSFSGTLYAQSAVLMDGGSGRVLYAKNGEEFRANASTTKILTCILALENANLTDVVTVSSYAATMPDVQLHIKEGEQYYLEDLLYSLMLESHNDVAVAIAEHISGSQEEFSKLMNQKAKEIGCENTIFLTPNGLDAIGKIKSRSGMEENTEQKEERFHGTTAKDLALIMRYCIKISPMKEEFIHITQTPAYTFRNIEGNRSFTCRNHNSFFNMMEGVISGKTGFTSKAGYCYVGALEQDGKCYVVALLACGWPGNKNYKWIDCRKLMEYGLKEYELYSWKELEKEYKKELTVEVKNAKRHKMDEDKIVDLKRRGKGIRSVLLKPVEKIEFVISKEELTAPVEVGETVGIIEYFIQGEKWMEEELYCNEKVEKTDFRWCLVKVLEKIVQYS